MATHFADAYKSIGMVSAHEKKWVSAAASATGNDAQALYVKKNRSVEIAPKFQIAFTHATLWNYSGSPATVGLGVRFADRYWGAGQVSAGNVYTDDTIDAQDVGASDFQLHNGALSGSGFIVSCDARFNIVGVIQGTAGDQVAPVFVSEYWNTAGAWSVNTTAHYITPALNTGTGEKLLIWALPQDWAKGGSGAGVPQHRYNMRFTQTNGGAGTVSPSATQLFVGFTEYLHVDLGNGLFFDVKENPGEERRFPSQGDALFPIFSVAHLKNSVQIFVGEADIFSN